MNAHRSSENALYRNILSQRKSEQRQLSTIVMIVCVILQMAWLLFGGLIPLDGFLPYNTYLLLSPLVFGVLSIGFACLGFLVFRRTLKPITDEDITRFRQAERIRLFQQAEGKLPFAYSRWRIALEVLGGLLLAAGGISCLLYSFPDTGFLKYMYAFGLHGTALYVLYNALHIKPTRAREIPLESARELRRRLALGEETGESEAEDTQEAM